MRILYAGDSDLGGPANYLLGILKYLKASFVHIPPSRMLSPSLFKKRFDAILLSDFSRKNTPLESQKAIAAQVKKGTGLLMIGGWGSFSGPFGGWRGSLIEELLPVKCLGRDDRIHLPSGAWIIPSPLPSPPEKGRGEGEGEETRPSFPSHWFENPPVICGLNRVIPKKNSRVLLTAQTLTFSSPPQRGERIKVRGVKWGAEYPLLIIDSNPAQRIAALTTDLAPHWCGGLVDWGKRRLRLPVTQKIQIEVGELYVGFVVSLLKWLTDLTPGYSREELEGLGRLHGDEKKKGWIRLETKKNIDNLPK